MHRALALCLAAAALAGCRTSVPGAGRDAAPRVARATPPDVVAEADRMAARDLWPGFEPRTIPVAIFDGSDTWLFRHPAPPAGFAPDSARPGVWILRGRHQEVTANTSISLGGTQTAVLALDTERTSLAAHAALLIHESFHVFERVRHPDWTANEVELFTYPSENAEALALRMLETAALRRALAAEDDHRAACWAHEAMAARAGRFAMLPPGSVAYERGIEIVEGLAEYVEHQAMRSPAGAASPLSDYPPDAVRQRGYAVGLALALLLDRLSPDWRASLERSDSTGMDGLLSAAVRGRAGGIPPCTFSPATRLGVEHRARRHIAAMQDSRAVRRREFLAAEGWKVVVDAEAAPLYPQAFDPLNVQKVSAGEILHTRWLRLGRPGASIEVLGRAALTRAAGTHPLFEGVRTLTLTGFAREPAVQAVEGRVTLEAEGVRGEFARAELDRQDGARTVLVRLR